MRVVHDIIGSLCHVLRVRKLNTTLKQMPLYGQSVPLWLPLLFHGSNRPHFLWVDGRNKTTWHVGIALEKLPIHSPSKRLVVIKLFLCLVYGINNELYLSRLTMFFSFVYILYSQLIQNYKTTYSGPYS